MATKLGIQISRKSVNGSVAKNHIKSRKFVDIFMTFSSNAS